MSAARPRDYGQLSWHDLAAYYLARWRGSRTVSRARRNALDNRFRRSDKLRSLAGLPVHRPASDRFHPPAKRKSGNHSGEIASGDNESATRLA
ncbi:hypothetical protein [Pseudonocardia acaciae]|uniref:hypothetical protein n=1 Tax=Pseudonocardia acaciae TaxID=551276 RepID=UPI0012ED5E57|nr:hypothetical protein [Pseudonocardia acaciae]